MRNLLRIFISIALIVSVFPSTNVSVYAAGILNFDAIAFTEGASNDGSVDTSLTITLSGDTFAVSGGVMTETTHYNVVNEPAGLSVLITGTSATTATVELSGHAVAHNSVDNISDLEISFLDAAFTGGDAAGTANGSISNLSVNYDDPELSYNMDTFVEASANDGSIATVVTATLKGDTFVVSSGVMTENTHYTVANVPDGLTPIITGTSGTTATLTLNGNGAAHMQADDIADLTVNFLDGAFTNSTSAVVTGASKSDFTINYLEPYSLSYDGSAFTEAVANDGSIDTSIIVTLNVGAFAVENGMMTATTHYNVANVPSGLTLVVTGTSATTATITLSGNADTGTHNSGDNVSDLAVNFLDDAFVGFGAADVSNTEKVDYTITYRDPTINYSTTTFTEKIENDGGVEPSAILTLEGETFTVDGDNMILDTHYSLANVPGGLTVGITGNSTSAVTVTLSGNAASHGINDSISNFGITFLDPVFTDGDATIVSNYNRSDLEIDFVDAFDHMVGYQGTNIDYDEADGGDVLVAPSIQVTGESKYIEFEIGDATVNEVLGLQTVGNPDTGNGVVTIVGTYVYLGDGVNADIIGSIDPNNDGQNGDKLRIRFSDNIPNGDFTEALVGSDIPNWTEYDEGIVMGSLASRSQGNALTISGTGPYTMTKADPNGYSYETDYDYGQASGNLNHEIAWMHESIERPTGTLTTSLSIVNDANAVGGVALELSSGGSVVSDNSYNGSVRYGSHFGPYIVSDAFTANEGDGLSLDWKAVANSDQYEVYGFLVNADTDEHNLFFYGRGSSQDWTPAAGAIPADGNYKFKFVNGTYDKTGAYAVGSYMYIDNIRLMGSNPRPAPIVQQIIRLVTYSSSDPDPATTRTLSLTLENNATGISTQTATININSQYNHPPTLDLDAASPILGIGANEAVTLFNNSDASTVEAGEHFTGMSLTANTLVDGADEILVIDGTDIVLTDGNSGTTIDSSINYNIALAGGTATVTLSGFSLSELELNSLIDNIKYKNNNEAPVAGTRTIKITGLTDDGGTINGGTDTSVFNESSQVTIKVVVDDFVSGTVSQTTVDFIWTAASGASSLKIQVSTDDGSTWTDASHDTLATDATSGQVTGLSVNTNYRFRLVVIGGSEEGNSNIVTVRTLNNTSIGDKTNETDETNDIVTAEVSGDNGAKGEVVELPVDVDIKTIGGQKSVNMTFNKRKLDTVLKEVKEGSKNSVISLGVDAQTINADSVTASLKATTIEAMTEKDIVLKIDTGKASYSVPMEELSLDVLSNVLEKELGNAFEEEISDEDIQVSIEILTPEVTRIKDLEENIRAKGYESLVEPVEFKIKATYKGKTAEVKKFSNYVKREIALGDDVDPSMVTTAITVKEDGTILHIPTYILLINGRYYAVINSLTNSIYTIIYNETQYNDIRDHWAEESILDVTARLIMDDNNSGFRPDVGISRQTFTAAVTRGLGIKEVDPVPYFVDYGIDSYYFDEVHTAYEYGIIVGYGDDIFHGDKFMTRQEGMKIIALALDIANKELLEAEIEGILSSFDDGDEVASWAREYVAICIKYDIIQGYDGKIHPLDDMTRAETAQIIRNLLLQPELINSDTSYFR